MSEEVEKVLFPQVQWAQRKQLIILRVLVKPVEVSLSEVKFAEVKLFSLFQNPDFTIRKDYMTFKGATNCIINPFL